MKHERFGWLNLKPAFQLNLTYSWVVSSVPSADMAEAAFNFCAYEFTIRTINSPWCQLFNEEGAKVGDLCL